MIDCRRQGHDYARNDIEVRIKEINKNPAYIPCITTIKIPRLKSLLETRCSVRNDTKAH